VARAFDIVVAGVGPVGLTFAASLAGAGLRIALVDPQAEAALADSTDDERDRADRPQHRDAGGARRLGQDPGPEIAPLRRMQVLNGPSDYAMQLGHSGTGSDMLGRFVRGQRWNRSRAVTDAERARQRHYSAWRFHSVTGMRGISNRSRVRLYQPPLCMRPTRSSFGVSM